MYDPSVVSAAAAEGIVEAVVEAISCMAQDLPERLGELRQHIAAALPAPSFPATAKVRPESATRAGDADTADESSDAAKMLGIFRRSIGSPDVGLDDDFFALGGTSIQAAIAFAEIERQFGRTLPLSTLFSAGSVRNLMQVLELPPVPESSLVSIQGFGDRPPIVAISGIGGNVVGLSSVARALGQDQPLFGLQPAALGTDDLPPTTIEAIAEAFIAEFEPIQHGAFVLLGICFGANVAIEMAHQLKARNRAPALVVVLDPSFEVVSESAAIAAPQMPSTLGFVTERVRLLLQTYRETDGEQRRVWLREKSMALIRKIRHRDLLHGNHQELRQQRVEAANIYAAKRYRPRPYGGAMHTMITRDRPVDCRADPRITWLELMKRETCPVRIPGRDTGDALSNHAVALADQLRRWIDAIVDEAAAAKRQALTNHQHGEAWNDWGKTASPD